MCTWSTDILATPLTTNRLSIEADSAHLKKREASVTCMCLSDDGNTFFVGCEEGKLAKGMLKERAGVERGLEMSDVGHDSAVLGIDARIGEFSGILVSCGMDWKVRVWNAKVSLL